MMSLSSRPDWYLPGDDDPALDPAREAFKLAVQKFGSELTSDARKRDRVSSVSGVAELQNLVVDAQTRYLANSNGGAQKWLQKLSKKIMHYSAIFDVLVQHHPEYVSLAWGAMKFLFVAVVNHEALLSCIAKALAQIADTLPGVEVAAVLFPTEPMKRALAEIYAHTMRFFVRAHDWFGQSKLKRAYHSVTRPKELRYDDLIDDIKTSTAHFRNLAVTSSQAEQRDMHILLLEMKQMMTTYQQINSSAMLNTNMALTDLQFSNILNALTNLPLEDPDKCLQRAMFLTARSARSHKPTACEPFWLHPRFQAWATSPTSDLIMVKGSYTARAAIKDCLVNAIEQIRLSKATALWALKTQSAAGDETFISVVELIKYLTAQALQFGPPPTERSLSLSCARFQSARGEKEWISLLAGSLADLKHVFIVVDIELLASQVHVASPHPSSAFKLPELVGELFAQLSRTSPGTTVKVMLASYGSPVFGDLRDAERKDLIVAGRGRPQRPVANRAAARSGLVASARGRGQLRRGFGLDRLLRT
ncbi:hypothetical protein B0T16DRAFT_355986 [Cercophora newfieldiana]|uniref:DUF7708 domain-containing protein n=1 Tax=Cercophora newfieldiana TaxID=92897 RepID=A0AA39Y1D9_9PEZI|nr:hypothetical protein B0T16DRAFT_355986 [Cercophora newfieldiana]